MYKCFLNFLHLFSSKTRLNVRFECVSHRKCDIFCSSFWKSRNAKRTIFCSIVESSMTTYRKRQFFFNHRLIILRNATTISTFSLLLSMWSQNQKKSYSSRIMTIKNFHFRTLILWIEFIKNKWFRSIKIRKLITSKSILYNVCRINKIKLIFVCENDCTINFFISLYKYCIWQHFFIKNLQILITVIHLNLSIVSSFHFAKISITTKIFEISVVNSLQNQNWFICIFQNDDVDFSMNILRVSVHVNKRIIFFNFRFQKFFNVLIDFRAINVILNMIVLIRMQWIHDQKHDIIFNIQLFHHFHFIIAWRHVSNNFIALISRCEIVEYFVKFAISIFDDDEFFDELFDLIAHSKIIDIKKINVSFRFDSNDKNKNFQRKQLKSKY